MRGALALLMVLVLGHAASAAPAPAPVLPRYAHIFVIIEENHTFDEILGKGMAPNFDRLAKTYGIATNFYAERHPSQPNYIALLGGDTFGIADDDGYFCKAGIKRPGCANSDSTAYANHTVAAESLADQLEAHGLTWKGYFEDIPSSDPGAYDWPAAPDPKNHLPAALYVAKHNGFIAFKSVQDDPRRADKLVGFDVFKTDAQAGTLPNFAVIVPNQCNDMHGLHGSEVPTDCEKTNDLAMIARGDRAAGEIVDAIMASPIWQAPQNAAIIVTFDENDIYESGGHASGCCAPNSVGGGWIATLVITNHGPRALRDPTPYNHYSLLRTIEDAFGLKEHLGHAATPADGGIDMTPLFAVAH